MDAFPPITDRKPEVENHSDEQSKPLLYCLHFVHQTCLPDDAYCNQPLEDVLLSRHHPFLFFLDLRKTKNTSLTGFTSRAQWIYQHQSDLI